MWSVKDENPSKLWAGGVAYGPGSPAAKEYQAGSRVAQCGTHRKQEIWISENQSGRPPPSELATLANISENIQRYPSLRNRGIRRLNISIWTHLAGFEDEIDFMANYANSPAPFENVVPFNLAFCPIDGGPELR